MSTGQGNPIRIRPYTPEDHPGVREVLEAAEASGTKA